MPTAVILMELVYQLYQAGHMLAPTHSRRDDNQWADELTHPDPQGFDPALRVDLTPYFHKLALIPKILEAGDTALWQDNMDTHLWPFGEGWGLDPEHVNNLPAAADGAVMGGNNMEIASQPNNRQVGSQPDSQIAKARAAISQPACKPPPNQPTR